MHGIAIPHAVISSVARNLFRPLFPSSFAKPFTGSTAPAFPRHGVSRFSLSNTHRLTINEKDPSTSLGMTIRETRLSHFPRHGVSRSSLSNTLRLTVNEKDPSTSLGMTIRETRLFHFPRYGVSVSCYQTCTINKRAMNVCVHGSFTCGKTGSHLPGLTCSSAGSPSGTHSFPFSHPHYQEGGRHSGKASRRRCIPG